MGDTVFLFSGQGSQHAGMGTDLCRKYGTAASVYKTASEILGMDVSALSAEGGELISQTKYSQPLIYTLSMAVLAVLGEYGVKPDAVAGFSLGECSAMTAAGAINLETGFKLIRLRAARMQEAAEKHGGAMAAILGTPAQTIEAACRKAEGYVAPVNYNCPGQIVIAGETAAVAAAADTLAAGGAKVVRLAVNSAFHSRIMNEAAAAFRKDIADFPFQKPAVPFYSNLTGERLEVDNFPEYFQKQMTSPVRFSNEMAAMGRDGYTRFVELGPGKTLCGFIRRGLKGAKFMNAEDCAGVEKCVEALKTMA